MMKSLFIGLLCLSYLQSFASGAKLIPDKETTLIKEPSGQQSKKIGTFKFEANNETHKAEIVFKTNRLLKKSC